MSTVTAVRKNGYVSVAADTLTTFGTTKLRHNYKNDSKLIKWGENVIGFTGRISIKMILLDLIEDNAEAPDFSSARKIYKYFNKLHAELKEKYFLRPNDDVDDPVEASHLSIVIANKHGIFGVYSLREVYDYQRFWAFGSGGEYALGALHALYELDDVDARQVAEAGIRAGIEFDDGTDAPVESVMIKLEK